jgi:hypothetical protein
MKIADLDQDDVMRGWEAYDAQPETLRRFILDVPAAKLAHDAAVSAMKQGDNQARGVWEGFLRALFVCALKSGEISPSKAPAH